MVNKAALGILGVIVLASFGVGTLVGMQIAGTDSGELATDSNSTDSQQAADASNETAVDETGSTETTTNGTQSTSTATATPTPTERQTEIPAHRFDDEEIADHVVRFVNDERAERGRDRLSVGGATSATLRTMAVNHSGEMADAGETAHTVRGVSTRERYKNYEIYEKCRIKLADKNAVRYPDESFESVGFTYAGQPYEANGETEFNADERAVARTIVDNWMADDEFRERLLMVEPTRVGVGVEITGDGGVYVSANTCA